MAKIRQEINILAGESVADGLSGSAIVQLDTTQYNGTVTYYFEIIAVTNSSSDCVVRLTRLGTTTDDATITVGTSVTTKTRLRSSAFTPPSGATSYFIRLDGVTNTCTVNVARIIVIQEFTTLTNTETQIEIGNAETGLLNTTQTALTNPKYWLYTAANWDGTLSCFAEVTYTQASNMKNTTIVLQEDNGSFASWTNKVTIVNAGTAATPTLVRASFTPTDGRNYRITTASSSNMITHSVFNAKVVVRQLPSTAATHYFNASDAGPTDPGTVWTNDANAFDGLTSTIAATTTNGSVSSNYLQGDGTDAPTTGDSITLVKSRIFANPGTVTEGASVNAAIYSDGLGELLGTATKTSAAASGWGDYLVLSTPSGGWTWQKINDLEVKCYLLNYVAGTPGVVRVEVDVSTTGITKLEPQYLLANTGSFGASTGLKDYDTLYDPAEWDGVL
jgi:hypothetical protein